MTNNEQIRIGIVGCGEHSHVHAQAASGLKELKITACCKQSVVNVLTIDALVTSLTEKRIIPVSLTGIQS